jgi:hypothetical protein
MEFDDWLIKAIQNITGYYFWPQVTRPLEVESELPFSKDFDFTDDESRFDIDSFFGLYEHDSL